MLLYSPQALKNCLFESGCLSVYTSFTLLIAKWEAIVGVQVAEWGVKQMKTKWGNCNIKAH